jgi:hypothetical protein
MRGKEEVMNRSQSAKQSITLLLVFLLAIAPLARRADALTDRTVNQNEADEDGVTFDNLLAASSYTLYVEARNIGDQVRSGGLSEIIEPLLPALGHLPKEVDALARFVVMNANVLSRSRLMIATEPVKASLPPVLIALELASADAAQEFEGKLKELMVSIFTPALAVRSGSANLTLQDQEPKTTSPFVVKRAGRVLAFSPSQFTFKGLRAEGDKPISDDLNFRAAHDRFYSEALFLYYDLALSKQVIKEHEEAMAKQTEGTQGVIKEGIAVQMDPSGQPGPDSPPPIARPLGLPQPETQTSSDKRRAGAAAGVPSKSAASAVSAASAPSKSRRAAASSGRRAGRHGVKPSIPPSTSMPEEVEEPRRSGSDQLGNFLEMIVMGSLTKNSLPDAAALALTLESNSLILRALVVTAQGTQPGPIPFISVLASGPAQASDAANYLPADTDIFATVSLDLPRLHDTTLAMFGAYEGAAIARARKKDKAPSFESKMAAFEKANGFKIRDEIEATLGSEIAVGLPARYLSGTPIGRVPLSSQMSQSGPVFLVSVRNKEALQSRLRPVLEAIGLKSPNEKGLTEKYGNVEINTYSQVSLAFINHYLVIGTDAATVRRVIDARAKNETLATSRDFHNYMQWQPRETLAQVYVSGAILKGLFRNAKTPDDKLDDEGRQFLARYSFEPEPITYVAASDAPGPLYELRIPKNLLMRAFAEMAVDEMRQRLPRNEMIARSTLHSLVEMEKAYKTEHARYGTLEELEGFTFAKGYLEKSGYKLDLTASGNGYEATATPVEYGKSGRLSFYIDQSGVIREGDHGGRPATAGDKQSDSNLDN